MKHLDKIRAKILAEEQLERIRSENQNKKIVFCAGCFDILHSGHVVFFNNCAKLGDILVVGVGRDSVIRDLKGPSRPINSEENRIFLIASLLSVGYVIPNQEILEFGEVDYRKTLTLLKPDIFAINDDNSKLDINRKVCEEHAVEFIVLNRNTPEGLKKTSTSDIISKSNC